MISSRVSSSLSRHSLKNNKNSVIYYEDDINLPPKYEDVANSNNNNFNSNKMKISKQLPPLPPPKPLHEF
jgi:hypothetical protein